jgi:hypothetical protein
MAGSPKGLIPSTFRKPRHYWRSCPDPLPRPLVVI